MSAFSSKSPSTFITRRSSRKRKISVEEADIQRKRASLASRPQPVNRFTEDVRNAQSREAGDGTTLPSQVPPIISELPPMNRKNGGVRREAGGNGDIDFSISTNARYIAKEPHFGNCGDGVFQKGEDPSISLFQGSSNVNIDYSDNATIIQFGDGKFTEVQRDLICDHIANLAIFPDIDHILNRNFLVQLIINLPRAEAVFDDYQTKKKSGPCLKGTRVALLREMADWVTGQDESRIYVLSGLAGIGKSTVAYTIASRAADLNLLGASFFFSRDEHDRKNAKKFFTTIAYQFCVYNETFAKAIGDVLQTTRGSAAITKGPQEQLQVLIVDPLQSIVQLRARPILIVVDALDECDEEDELCVLTGLRELVRVLPSFKVILTTRPQPCLDRFFGSHGGHKIFRLQDIEDKVVDGDIRLYLDHCLSLEQVQERLPTNPWYASDKEIDALVRAAGRLFIIASTAVRYILDKIASDPAAQMQKLLHTFAQDRMAFNDLNEFYTVILGNVVPGPVDCDDDIVNLYQSVVGTIVFVQHVLPVTTLARLINIDVEDIRAVLLDLQSVILLGDDDIPRIHHKSFKDYIANSKRRKDIKLAIDTGIQHMRIARRCFQIMEQNLKYNISGLGTPARFMSNEDGLAKDGITDEQLEGDIPQHLRYACVYWANHLKVANIEDADLMKELKQFADEHMLHWIEVLSLIRRLDSAHRAIRVVLTVLKPTSSDLRQLLLDGLRFISKFYATIKRSALHTYYSALPFAPTDSLLYRRYITEAVHNLCVIDGGPKKWDAFITNLSHGEHVNVIKFSFDSTMFVSLSMGMLKVWDAATGTPISKIRGEGFAIANDFSILAAFEGNAITLYDVNGSERGAIFTTRAKISTVAVSSERNRIAALSSDQTLHLWDSRNGELIGSFDGFASHHRDRNQDWDWDWDPDRLQFSATSARLAYPSASGGFVHLRNGIDGSSIAYLDCESPLHVIAFSPDGSRIATLSESGLKLWNCEDGKLVGVACNADKSLAISANGSLLATGFRTKVTLWSGNSGNLALVEVFHLDGVWTMAFSLDDTLAITTEDDILLYNVKSRSFMSKLSFSDSIALAFSPNSTRLAAGNSGGAVYLWDIQGIETSSASSNKQARAQVTALALSRDCSRIACGFEYGGVELWETGILAKQRIAAHTHHRGEVRILGWSPNGKRFASGSDDGTINLWDGGGGALCGALQYSTESRALAVEVSDIVLAVAGENGIFVWDLKTLDHIHTFDGCFGTRLSFSANGALLAAVRKVAPNNTASDDISRRASPQTIIFDITKYTIISTFDIDSCAMAFLPDNSQLIVQHDGDDNLLTFNLVNLKLMRGPTFEHFIQLRNMPLWHGVPVSIKHEDRQWYLGALFSQHEHRVPVLWIPRELGVQTTAQGHSMIALGCEDGRIILLRPHSSPFGRLP